MNDAWRVKKRDVFIRDIVRDYCKVHIILSDQSARFAHSGTISYAVLNELLGDVLRKGVLWRLKDAAHHIFRTHPDEQNVNIPSEPLAEMLDWCVGYTFHECVKLKEDAFQRQHYTNRLLQLQNNSNKYSDILNALMPFTQQTHESINREMQRIIGVLERICELLLLFLVNHGDNGHVARLLVEDSKLVQKSFGQNFDKLLTALYNDAPAKRYLIALQLTLDNGHIQKAENIMAKAEDDHAPADIIDEMKALIATSLEQSS